MTKQKAMTTRDHRIMRHLATFVSAGCGLLLLVACASMNVVAPQTGAPRPAPRMQAAPPVHADAAPVVRVQRRAVTEADLPMGISCGVVRASASALDPDKPVVEQVRAGAAARGLRLTDLQIEAIASCLDKS